MKQSKSIPLNTFPDVFNPGIIIAKTNVSDLEMDGVREAHRDDYHLFFILEEGSGLIEVDFQQYHLQASSVLYIQPYQVHRGISMENGVFTVLIISSESINAGYLQLLKDIAPTPPLPLEKNIFSILSEMAALSIKLYEREDGKLHQSMLKDCSNALVAFIISQYLVQSNRSETLTRPAVIAKTFKSLLDLEFIALKRPMDYAEKLKVSTVYLNECLKNTTGQSVSSHIQQRIVLEAKRLLYHSNKSVKEIASDLGYTDYPYFSRLFKKVSGMTALSFRNRNLD